MIYFDILPNLVKLSYQSKQEGAKMHSKTISVIGNRFIGKSKRDGGLCACCLCLGLPLTKLFLFLGIDTGPCSHHVGYMGADDRLESVELSLGD